MWYEHREKIEPLANGKRKSESVATSEKRDQEDQPVKRETNLIRKKEEDL